MIEPKVRREIRSKAGRGIELKSQVKTYSLVYLFLMLLLALTVVLSYIPLGNFGTPASLLIACLKSLLVLLFFMNLRYRSPSFRLVALASLLWLFFLFGITGVDYLTRGLLGPLGK